jgi:hypothetical protein
MLSILAPAALVATFIPFIVNSEILAAGTINENINFGMPLVAVALNSLYYSKLFLCK